MRAVQPTILFMSGKPVSAALGASGNSARRVGVTNNGRSAPAFAWPMTVGALLQANCTCPPSTALVTSPPPL